MRTIKTLGIATAMALALIAFAGAGAASANNFKAEVQPEKWSGSLVGKEHVLSLNGESFTCSKVAFSGETVGYTLSSVEVSPELNGCSHRGYFGLGWTMNGCKFKLYAGEYQGIGGMDIVGCTKPMRFGLNNCVTEISDQMGPGGFLQSIQYKNVGSGSTRTITAVAKLSGIRFTRTGTTCSAATGSFENGTYTGEWTVKGSNSGGVQAGLEIESTPLPPAFYAEYGPATLSGGYSFESFRFMFDLADNGRIYCIKPSFSGTAALVPTEAIAVTPSFKNCLFESQDSKEWYYISDESLTAGGCSYQLPAKGGFDIVGASCAANPIKVTITGCVFKVGPQSSAVGPTLKNQGTGTSRTVRTELSPQKTTYTAEGAGCAKTGTISTGSAKVGGAVFSAKTSGGAAQGFWIE